MRTERLPRARLLLRFAVRVLLVCAGSVAFWLTVAATASATESPTDGLDAAVTELAATPQEGAEPSMRPVLRIVHRTASAVHQDRIQDVRDTYQAMRDSYDEYVQWRSAQPLPTNFRELVELEAEKHERIRAAGAHVWGVHRDHQQFRQRTMTSGMREASAEARRQAELWWAQRSGHAPAQPPTHEPIEQPTLPAGQADPPPSPDGQASRAPGKPRDVHRTTAATPQFRSGHHTVSAFTEHGPATDPSTPQLPGHQHSHSPDIAPGSSSAATGSSAGPLSFVGDAPDLAKLAPPGVGLRRNEEAGGRLRPIGMQPGTSPD